ncbi:dynein light chain Tctex-type 5-like [Culicoides brevitarsis]|uniref:dynein light chain Tctex-type 5-like n=1 Tax=Culicoides brevitarsis TaxID=469753 RepID=UPI00307C8888
MMFSRLKKAVGLSISQHRGSRAGSVLADQISQITGAGTTGFATSKKKNIRFKQEEEAPFPNLEDLPKPNLPFDVEKIAKRMETIVETKINYIDEDTEQKVWVPYDAQKCTKLSQELAREIKEDIKTLEHLERYRTVVIVSVVQKQLQGINYKMKYCTDPQRDSFAFYTYENSHFYIIATAGLIYKD